MHSNWPGGTQFTSTNLHLSTGALKEKTSGQIGVRERGQPKLSADITFKNYFSKKKEKKIKREKKLRITTQFHAQLTNTPGYSFRLSLFQWNITFQEQEALTSQDPPGRGRLDKKLSSQITLFIIIHHCPDDDGKQVYSCLSILIH